MKYRWVRTMKRGSKWHRRVPWGMEYWYKTKCKNLLLKEESRLAEEVPVALICKHCERMMRK